MRLPHVDWEFAENGGIFQFDGVCFVTVRRPTSDAFRAWTPQGRTNKDRKGLRFCYDFWPCQFSKFCRDWEMPSKY